MGTHALIYEGVAFARLGVAVIDEQHRFGVEQRDLFAQKEIRERAAVARVSRVAVSDRIKVTFRMSW